MGPKHYGVGEICDFRQYLAIISEMAQGGDCQNQKKIAIIPY